ncbi:MAG: C40 family peptidase [Clostridia bacterium]|nr:C40 family peptidase [Clostridia bacterium]
MKPTKKLATALLALTFSFPAIFLTACKNSAEVVPPEHSSEEILETPPELPEVDLPPQTPPTQTPSTPPTQPPELNPAPVVPTKAEYIRCTGDSVNIRSGAGTEYSVLGSAEKGTTYVVLGKTGNWYKTYYRNKTAYIYASYASVFTLQKSDDTDVEKVISEGYKLLGVPYVYGAIRLHDGKGKLLSGFSAQKFDCSSLIQYIFYKGADTLLDVTTRTQVVQGKFVRRSDLQRGDCIYFTNESRQNKKGVERIGHVALYLGDNYILHTASDYARIEKMTAGRWAFYIEARRFV